MTNKFVKELYAASLLRKIGFVYEGQLSKEAMSICMNAEFFRHLEEYMGWYIKPSSLGVAAVIHKATGYTYCFCPFYNEATVEKVKALICEGSKKELNLLL